MSIGSNLEDVSLSVVIPAFNERESLQVLLREIDEVIRGDNVRGGVVGTTEVIVVDDGSNDGTFNFLKQADQDYKFTFKLRVFRLRRNSGKSTALKIGLRNTLGSTVALMDADLQDNPADLISMVETSRQNGSLVVGWKKVRRDPLSKRIPSKIFNSIVSGLSGVSLHDHNCGFKVGPGVLFRAIPMYGELHRFIPCLAAHAGYPVDEVVVAHRARRFGKSKFGFERFIRGLADLLTVAFINRYSNRPNHAFTGLSIASFFVGSIIFAYLFAAKLFWNLPIDGRPLFDIGMLLLLSSLILTCFGFVLEVLLRHTSGRSWVEGLEVVEEFGD